MMDVGRCTASGMTRYIQHTKSGVGATKSVYVVRLHDHNRYGETILHTKMHYIHGRYEHGYVY